MRAFCLVTALALPLAACAAKQPTVTDIPIAKESAKAGTTVSRKGSPVKLAATDSPLKVDAAVPTVALADSDWKPVTLQADGKVKLVSIVPSVDTRVCEQQTHLLGESTDLSPKVERITISRDLPAAQKRFAQESQLLNIKYLSDYRAGAFGQKAGLLMEDSGLLARAVAVVDGQGKVRYLQVVPDVTNLPDMTQAIKVANDLAK